ncbi:MAG: DUF2281 domain-containing protein [Nostoc sp.]|uniref:DUF2281 domain-containing protein n=1 Tax=Nostoc sp. TaxID=1180 RepID=UPI002FF688FD
MTAQTITLPETFLAQLQTLPPEQIQQVIDFVEFLNRKYVSSQPSQSVVKQARVLGLHQGMGWISEDFNDLLPDEFWTGEP